MFHILKSLKRTKVLKVSKVVELAYFFLNKPISTWGYGRYLVGWGWGNDLAQIFAGCTPSRSTLACAPGTIHMSGGCGLIT